MIITKEILKDLRAARSLVVRRDRKGVGSVTCIIEDKLHGKSVEVRKQWLIDVDICHYDPKLSYDEKRSQYCVSVVMDLKYQSVERTAIQMIKPGDDVSFLFIGSNNNDHLRKAGLHHDELNLIIKRKNEKLRFRLDDRVGPADSSRMIGGTWNHSDIDIHSYDLENRVIPEESTV